jgi:hypothetical protein
MKYQTKSSQMYRKFFFWGAGELGLEILQLLVEWLEEEGVDAELVGVAISASDVYALEIEKVAIRVGATIYIDKDVPASIYNLGLKVDFPFAVEEQVGATIIQVVPKDRKSGRQVFAELLDELVSG